MKTLYLHIGSHKTGTTSIQKTLYNNKELLENNNFHLFSNLIDGRENISGNSSISWFSKGDKYQDDIYEGFGLNITNLNLLTEKLITIPFKNIILSGEDFSWIFRKKQISEIYEKLCKKFVVKVIVYIRRQDRHVVSHYQQASKSNNSNAFGYYRNSSHKAIPDGRSNYDEYLDYFARLSFWGDIFGDENITIRVF